MVSNYDVDLNSVMVFYPLIIKIYLYMHTPAMSLNTKLK